ncbi:hypothetical protein ACGFZK_02900 [Streptomyces sp. NPDC048257]|uniref:hypothetical protein n=1 Tax=Streptomyces sp. NPDC048257 TaxID=3365526 RepID=UPI003711B7A5
MRFTPGPHPAEECAVRLATGGNDFTIRLWNTRRDTVVARICGSAYPRITQAEWARYFAAVDFALPCPAA